MAGSIPFPPHLNGPRLAVWANFPFDNRTVAPGVTADWAWAMKQWDRVIAAGPTVRLVIVDTPYSRIDAFHDDSRAAEFVSKVQACVDQGQLVFGRVYVAGGRLALEGDPLPDPLDPTKQVPPVGAQIRAWADEVDSSPLTLRLRELIRGIHLDSGPTACTDPAQPDSVAAVVENYRQYSRLVTTMGYLLSVHAPRHPDTQPSGWLQSLDPTFITVWDGGVTDYESRFQARNPCRPAESAGVPAWWDPGKPDRWSRVHVINDCTDEAEMKAMVDFAIKQRHAGTIWVTRSRSVPAFGTVFDVLPSYFESEFALFHQFVAADEANKPKETTEKPPKEDPEKPPEPEKTEPEKTEPEKTEPEKTEPEKTEPEKGKEREKPEPEKFPIDKPEKGERVPETVKDHERNMLADRGDAGDFGGLDIIGRLKPDEAPEVVDEAAGGPVGRTFIRAEERPEIGTEDADPDDVDEAEGEDYGTTGRGRQPS